MVGELRSRTRPRNQRFRSDIPSIISLSFLYRYGKWTLNRLNKTINLSFFFNKFLVFDLKWYYRRALDHCQVLLDASARRAEFVDPCPRSSLLLKNGSDCVDPDPNDVLNIPLTRCLSSRSSWRAFNSSLKISKLLFFLSWSFFLLPGFSGRLDSANWKVRNKKHLARLPLGINRQSLVKTF